LTCKHTYESYTHEEVFLTLRTLSITSAETLQTEHRVSRITELSEIKTMQNEQLFLRTERKKKGEGAT
jgi:hypothetical protein